MKKSMILAAFAAMLSLASCQKMEIVNNSARAPVFTASINPGTKTSVDVSTGKLAWESDDEIYVTDASSNTAIYAIESIDAATGKATFVIKDGQAPLGSGPYTASYGSEPAAAQTYSATAGKLHMTAPATSDTEFRFTVQCGLMRLILTKADENVKMIAVSGTTAGGSEARFTLTCDEAQSIATAKDFYISLPSGSYNKIEIMSTSGVVCTLNAASGLAVEANHIRPVTLDESKLNFAQAANWMKVEQFPSSSMSGSNSMAYFKLSATAETAEVKYGWATAADYLSAVAGGALNELFDSKATNMVSSASISNLNSGKAVYFSISNGNIAPDSDYFVLVKVKKSGSDEYVNLVNPLKSDFFGFNASGLTTGAGYPYHKFYGADLASIKFLSVAKSEIASPSNTNCRKYFNDNISAATSSPSTTISTINKNGASGYGWLKASAYNLGSGVDFITMALATSKDGTTKFCWTSSKTE